jgi:hypothetical protein
VRSWLSASSLSSCNPNFFLNADLKQLHVLLCICIY